jgi:phosphocarrier protein
MNTRKPEAVVVIRNLKGLHARASAKFVKCAESFNARITVDRDGQSVGGTSWPKDRKAPKRCRRSSSS